MRVLIVEDNVAQCESLAMVLEVAGYSTLHAHSVDGAEKVLETHPADAIILDWVIPNGGGRKFMESIHPDADTNGIPVIVTTGLDCDRIPSEITNRRDVVVLQKPFPVDDLLAALKSMGCQPLHHRVWPNTVKPPSDVGE